MKKIEEANEKGGKTLLDAMEQSAPPSALPDIIVHKRGSNNHNLIVLEATKVKFKRRERLTKDEEDKEEYDRLKNMSIL